MEYSLCEIVYCVFLYSREKREREKGRLFLGVNLGIGSSMILRVMKSDASLLDSVVIIEIALYFIFLHAGKVLWNEIILRGWIYSKIQKKE